MLDKSILQNLEQIKKSCLVIDIESSSHYPDSREINISSDFDNYVKFAKVKWVGLYSYLHDKEYYYTAKEFSKELIYLFNEHSILIGFNFESFDFPILVNNGLIDPEKKYLHIDCMTILGTANFKNKDGYANKNRAALMDVKLKSNSLESMAKAFGLEYQKGIIDYTIFHKWQWSVEEEKEIIKYLQSDVMATKALFEKLWSYWLPFAELLEIKDIYNLSWIRSSIAALTYRAACKVLGTEPTYADKGEEDTSEQMGGRVIIPKNEETRDIYMCDFGSLYPHIISQFNLTAEVNPDDISPKRKIWHGNDVFQVKGYYDITEHHILSKYIADKLKERIWLKENSPQSPQIYTLKIFLNSAYGCFRSSIFEKVHTPNLGWDTCYIGQQISILAEEMFNQFGFDVILSDTDSFALKYQNGETTIDYVQDCINQVVEIIKDNVPFPLDTFKISIEKHLEYLMVPFSEEPIVGEDGKNIKVKNRLVLERKGKKKNYLYIYKDKEGKKIVKLIELPIKKDNSTLLAPKIYEEVLEAEIIKNNSAKFSKSYIESILNSYLQRPDAIELLSQEYKVKEASSYKNNCIQAQVSLGYFNGKTGIIRLIKNNKIGKAGKGVLYGTIEELLTAKITTQDLDLEKVWQELNPFIKYEKPEINESNKAVEMLAKKKRGRPKNDI